jgi:CRP/FNR family transcriptional regulator
MSDIQELAQRLGKVQHFRSLPAAELEKIILAGQVCRYRRDEVIFVEGDASAGLFVLLAGRVQLCKLSQQGQIAILAVFEPVIMFNEVAALDGGPNPVTAITQEDAVTWHLSSDHLEKILMDHPQLGVGLLRVMAARNRYLVGQFEDLSFRSVLARTAKLLLELSGNGTQLVDRRRHPNHQLAARIATVPEAFSRSLRVFRTDGYIALLDKSIQVLDAARLREAAQVGPKE